MRSDNKKTITTSRSQRKKTLVNRKKKRIILSILSLVLISIVSYATYFAVAANKTLNDIQGESLSSTSSNPRKAVVLKDKEPFSVLLLGVDEREDDSGRSDTIIVATINPKKESVKLVSIPRDTLLDIPGYGNDKVNAAFAYGGVNLAVQTVEKYLNLPINYYTKINMEGMVELVDAVGGINVDNKYAFELDGVTLNVGNFDLNGTEALQYARMRKQDPAGDFGRQERQKEVITKIAKKALGINSLANFDKIFNAVGKNVETNFTGSEIWELIKNYGSVANNIENVSLEGSSGFTYYIPSYGQDVYVWQPSTESLQDVSNQLREHIGLKAETLPSNFKIEESASSTQSSTSTTSNYVEEQKSNEPYVPPTTVEEPSWSPTPTVETPVVEPEAPAIDTPSSEPATPEPEPVSPEPTPAPDPVVPAPPVEVPDTSVNNQATSTN